MGTLIGRCPSDGSPVTDLRPTITAGNLAGGCEGDLLIALAMARTPNVATASVAAWAVSSWCGAVADGGSTVVASGLPCGGVQCQEGIHISAFQWAVVIGVPTMIGHSQAKLATATPRYSATTSSLVLRRWWPALAGPRMSPSTSVSPSTRNGASGVA